MVFTSSHVVRQTFYYKEDQNQTKKAKKSVKRPWSSKEDCVGDTVYHGGEVREVFTFTPYLHVGEVGEVGELPSCPRRSDWSHARGRRKRSEVDKKEMKETKRRRKRKEMR